MKQNHYQWIIKLQRKKTSEKQWKQTGNQLEDKINMCHSLPINNLLEKKISYILY